jgi:hypothetical protein
MRSARCDTITAINQIQCKRYERGLRALFYWDTSSGLKRGLGVISGNRHQAAKDTATGETRRFANILLTVGPVIVLSSKGAP